MSFEDLEDHIRRFFLSQEIHSNRGRKQQTKQQVLLAYRGKFSKKKRFVSWFYSWSKVGALLGMFLLIPGILSFLWSGERATAGEINPVFGLSEIVSHDGKTEIVRKRTQLHIGDTVRVASNSRAEVTLHENVHSFVDSDSRVKVVDADKLFVSQGKIEAESFAESEVSTHRGILNAVPGGQFVLEVLPTGEAKVVSKVETLRVSDWLDREMMLFAGEELRLKVDTQINNDVLPPNISLSAAQIQAIQQKLVLARTKLLTGVEKNIRRRHSGDEYIESAQSTFKSIVQVLNMDRSLQILRRINLGLIENKDVYVRLEEKTDNVVMLEETRAIEALFDILEKNRFQFGLENSELKQYNRYVLMARIFRLAPTDQQKYGKVLQQKYVLSLLRKVIDHEDRSDQIATLRSLIGKIPRDSYGNEFIQDLSSYLDETLRNELR